MTCNMRVQNNEVNDKIRTAFVGLLSQKRYSKITFKELASVTGMTRQNLYYYYESKESVLRDVIEEKFDEVYEKLVCLKASQVLSQDNTAFTKSMIEELSIMIIKDNTFVECFFDKEIEAFFFEKKVAFMKRLLGWIAREQGIVIKDPEYVHYLALQVCGSVFFVIKEWMLNNMDMQVDKLIAILLPVLEQIVPMLKQNAETLSSCKVPLGEEPISKSASVSNISQISGKRS